MINYNIGITTFSKRFHLVSSLIEDIRKYTDLKIFLCINGEIDNDLDEVYRKNILQLCIKYAHIYPIFFNEMRGLSKMWNTLIIHSNLDNILILNDDLKIRNGKIFESVKNVISNTNYSGLVKINNSFSHFIINKIIIHKIGYFDERLLGFGEEDGDIIYRFEKNNIPINSIYVEGVDNLVSDIRHDLVKSGIGKYSEFNRNFIYNIKYKRNDYSKYRGIFDYPMNLVIDDDMQYLHEKFYRKNKHKLLI